MNEILFIHAKAKCPNPECGQEIEKPQREWDMIPKDAYKVAIHVRHYRCPVCKRVFRIADKIPREQ